MGMMMIKRVGWLLVSVGVVLVAWLGGYRLVMGEGDREAVVWCTRPDGANGCETTIQSAVDLASDGDGILIAGGVYTESVVITKSLVITGGWVPAGWTLTETVINANGLGCAIDWVGGSGRVVDVTVMGGVPAGVCANQVDTLSLESLHSHNNPGHGIVVTATEQVTIANSLVQDNGWHGIDAICYYPSAIYFITNTIINQNNEHGFDADSYFCDYHLYNSEFSQNRIGLIGFWGACPLQTFTPTGLSITLSINNIISENDIGLVSNCGGYIQLTQNLIMSNRIGLNPRGAGIYSENSLIVGNSEIGLHVESGGLAGHNNTIANNGLAVLLDDTGFGCYGWSYFVHLNLVNTIVDGDWDWTYQEECPPPDDPYFYVVKAEYSLLSFLPMMTDVPFVAFMFGEGVSDVPPYFGVGYVPQIPSLAIDGGTSEGAPLVDFYGNPRPVDGDDDGLAKIDIGAVEAPAGTIYHTYHPISN